MRFYLGKLLQAVALSLIVMGLAIGLPADGDLLLELRLAMAAIVVFVIGRWVESSAV